MSRILWLALLLSLAAIGCGTSAVRSGDVASEERPAPAITEPPVAIAADDERVGEAAVDEVRPTPDAPPDTAAKEAPASEQVDVAGDEPAAELEPTPSLDFSGTELPPAPVGLDALTEQPPAGPQPVSLAIEDIEVVDADVIAVGVNPDQTFEVPPADQVGWYRFGPTPGEEGSAVLAAHIAFDGVDGVFRHLADVAVGAVVAVGFDDGTTQRYRIESVTEYLKDELPDQLWAREGDPQLTLITCGGDFNRQLSSYESNVVAVAVPI